MNNIKRLKLLELTIQCINREIRYLELRVLRATTKSRKSYFKNEINQYEILKRFLNKKHYKLFDKIYDSKI